jgi:hypothetical protein
MYMHIFANYIRSALGCFKYPTGTVRNTGPVQLCVCARAEAVDSIREKIRGCVQKFPNWPPGARTANGISSLPLDAVVSLFCESV